MGHPFYLRLIRFLTAVSGETGSIEELSTRAFSERKRSLPWLDVGSGVFIDSLDLDGPGIVLDGRTKSQLTSSKNPRFWQNWPEMGHPSLHSFFSVNTSC